MRVASAEAEAGLRIAYLGLARPIPLGMFVHTSRVWLVWMTVEQTASVLCPLGVFSSVRPVLVPVLGLVCAGAERSGYIRWGDFQHTLAEHLALLPLVGHVESSSRVGTMGGLLDGVWHHDIC